MKVSEAMTRGLEFVPADATVQEAATTMAEHDIGAVLVGAPDGLLGILTDRDVILRVVVEGRHPAEVPVGEVMSSTLFTCRVDDAVEAVERTMQERQVRRLPVLDENGRVVGIVARSDLALRQVGAAGREPGRGDSVDQAVASPH
jgi:CBS domain-containing protein